jgi:hypothetical protein
VRNAFALLRSEPVAKYEAAELAIRLTDPILSVQPHHRKIVALLKASIGVEAAIEALNRVEAGDAHSQEIREHLVCFLLLEQCSITEVQVAQLLNSAQYYRGEALTFAAEISRRRGVPESALDYAQAGPF